MPHKDKQWMAYASSLKIKLLHGFTSQSIITINKNKMNANSMQSFRFVRFNILSVIKRWCLCLYLQDVVEPIYFYIGAVFGLQAVYVTALFVCSWVMSGTWVAGMLAVAWYVINRWEEFCHTCPSCLCLIVFLPLIEVDQHGRVIFILPTSSYILSFTLFLCCSSSAFWKQIL